MSNSIQKQIATIAVFIFAITVSLGTSAQGLKANGKKIVDVNGNEVILRGMGLGGWMLQEPYMMEMGGFAGTQWQIKAKIKALIGDANTTAFYDAWHANHCTKGDIDSLAAWGFNSVRLPMHYNLYTLPIEQEPIAGANTWINKGFAMTDSLIKWCAARQIYVILDLHAAPGGQGKDAAISDGDPSKPSLWESDANRQKTIALWRKLAERYVNEPWVGGYDLINEPNWSFTAGGNQNGCSENSNAPLRQLYVDITKAIREVDTKHLIIIEGNCWGNNYNGIFPTWDNNIVVSFHKYWSYNDQGSIAGIINTRNQYNVPIWLGESGENSNLWFTDAISLVEKNGIGWAWWPMKKIGSVVNPLTITKTSNYQTLLDYWRNGGTAPTSAFAFTTLMQMAENSKIQNCTYRKDVIDAMFRQVADSTTLPFSRHRVPGVIHSSDYDLGKNNLAYLDTDVADYHVSTQINTTWNNGHAYRNDGVDIESFFDADANSNGYNVGWTADNEWLQYSIDVDSSAAYDVVVHYAYAASGSKIRLQSDNADITGIQTLAPTGGSHAWSSITLNDVILYKGNRKLKFVFDKGGINFSYLKFSISKPLSQVTMKVLSAETHNEFIYVDFNKRLVESTVTMEGFTCTVNGTPRAISNLAMNTDNPSQMIVSLTEQAFDGDDIKLSYSGEKVQASDGTFLENFSNLQVKNTLPVHLQIPGKIEAESFGFNQGLQLETTTDVGGGQNVGYTSNGDYLDYLVRVVTTGKYNMVVRIACLNSGGKIEVQQIADNGNVLNSAIINIPVTGGWQTWNNVNAEITLTQGLSKLRVKILQPEFNMNWYRFELSQGISEIGGKRINIYPNPAKDELTIEISGTSGQQKTISFLTLNGIMIKKKTLSVDESQTIFVGDLPKGFYIAELEMSGVIARRKLILE